MAPRNPGLYNGGVSSLVAFVRTLLLPLRDRLGITVLNLVLLILAVVIAAILISRYVAV